METNSMAKQIVIGIPGIWKSEEEITLSLAREGVDGI
jgi:hypothetical protein